MSGAAPKRDNDGDMIPAGLIKAVKEFVYSEAEKYQTPSIFHLELTNEKGQWLADFLQADKDIVLLGTLLMDCKLGKAFKEGRLSEHVEMSEKGAREIFFQFPELDEQVKKKVIYCVRQHHGVDSFYSLEAEICCNADCYKFVSVKGMLGGIRYTREMPFEKLIELFSRKADEKWHALTLDICKKELEPQYRVIKELLFYYTPDTLDPGSK